MRVLFIRHAAAADKSGFGGSDMDRPLTDDGRDEARRMFKALARVYPRLDAVVSSQAVRARETADILSACFGKVGVAETALLNPGCSWKEFRKVLGEVDRKHECIAVVGHEPDFSSILGAVVAGGQLRIDVKKASCIEADINSIGKGELKLVLTPKIIAKLTE